MILRSIWLEVSGLRMHAVTSAGPEREERPPLLLVHGAAVSSEHMRPAAEALAPHFPVYVPDLPGHGRSDDAASVLDAGGHAESLAAWMRAAGLARAHVLGNSFGCQVIAELAVRHPKLVDRAVLQGPTVDPAAHGVRQLGRWLVNFRREGSTQPRVTFRQWGRAGFRVFVETLRYLDADRIEEKLPRIIAPTLVVRGSRDPIIPQAWAEEAARLLPDGYLAVIPGETHTIVVSAPEKLAEVVVPFLAGTSLAGSARGSRTTEPAPRTRGGLMPTISEPRDLLLNELRSMLYVERQLAERVLPELSKEITEGEFREKIEHHRKETRRHVANLERCFELLGEDAKDDKSHAIDGLSAQHDKVAKNIDDDRVRDIFDAGAAAKTEHLEIAAYRGLITMAESMGESELVDLLEQNLDDEKTALKQAEQVAEKLGKEAAAAR